MGAAAEVAAARPAARAVPRNVLHDTLPRITESLALIVAGQSPRRPQWSRQEWQVAHAVAIIHGISPLLARGDFATGPESWHAFLEGQRQQTEDRCHALASLLAEIDADALQSGIPFVALKGAALHDLALYRPGERPMADLDLLLARRDLQPMAARLARLGYRVVAARDDEWALAPARRPRQVHLAEHADNGVPIELHASISWPMPVRAVDITPSLWPAAPRPGRNDYPSLAALMTHLLQHAAVNMQLRLLRMIQLHDLALLGARLSDADWQRVVDPAQPHGSWWAVPPLRLLRRYYPAAVPDDVFAALERACPPLLRFTAAHATLAGVSASNPRRSLVPALAWSRSYSEAARCVANRLKRGARALGSGSGLPQATELQPWITRSHRRRLLDVLRGRARPETVMIVAAALADEFSAADAQRQPRAA